MQDNFWHANRRIILNSSVLNLQSRINNHFLCRYWLSPNEVPHWKIESGGNTAYNIWSLDDGRCSSKWQTQHYCQFALSITSLTLSYEINCRHCSGYERDRNHFYLRQNWRPLSSPKKNRLNNFFWEGFTTFNDVYPIEKEQNNHESEIIKQHVQYDQQQTQKNEQGL